MPEFITHSQSIYSCWLHIKVLDYDLPIHRHRLQWYIMCDSEPLPSQVHSKSCQKRSRRKCTCGLREKVTLKWGEIFECWPINVDWKYKGKKRGILVILLLCYGCEWVSLFWLKVQILKQSIMLRSTCLKKDIAPASTSVMLWKKYTHSLYCARLEWEDCILCDHFIIWTS